MSDTQKGEPTAMTEKTYPKLTRSKVTISYRADDGYSSEVTYGDLRGDSDPKQVLLEAHRETARLLTLFNFEAEARAIAEEACSATRACFPERAKLQVQTLAFDNGMTVADLKAMIRDWPETRPDGEPCEVWIETGPNSSHMVCSAMPLNYRTSDDGRTTWADIILAPSEGESPVA